jgi:lipopolysaccharide export system ATP-binding protein
VAEEILNKKITSLLERFGIEKLRKNKANTLSGGERRRVEIARALIFMAVIFFLSVPRTILTL